MCHDKSDVKRTMSADKIGCEENAAQYVRQLLIALVLECITEGSLALNRFKLVFWYVLAWSKDINIG